MGLFEGRLDNHTCGSQYNSGESNQTGGIPIVVGSSNPTNSVVFTESVYLKASKYVFSAVNKEYPTKAACNIGVQEMSKILFGKVLTELNGIANTIYNNLESSTKWHKIDYTKVNEYANKGYFVLAAYNSGTSASGHVVTILPGHAGSTWKDIFVMDTGYSEWTTKSGQSGNSRSESQNIKNSFGEKKRTGQTGKFGIYYYK